jgi:lipid A 3-O-deacylase
VDRKIITVFLLLLSASSPAGVVIREENDAFTGSDGNYTQGMEILVSESSSAGRENRIRLRAYGIRNTLYTPTDISIYENQPGDRPWAGLTAALIEEWNYRKKDSWRTELTIGVLGEWSQSDHIQAYFHDIIECRKPKGWGNQIPNEPFVNVSIEYYRPLYVAGRQWGFDATGLCGGLMGTAFINVGTGLLLRGGWRVPPDYNLGLINPTIADMNALSAYLFIEAKGRAVAHNATLGGSLFQDGPSQNLELFVGDLRGGVSFGSSHTFGMPFDIRLVYSVVFRSREFRNQVKGVDYGSILLSVSKGF